MRNWKGRGRKQHGPMKTQTQHVYRGTEENDKNVQSL